MAIDIEPVVLTVRWYDENWGYAKVLPFKAVATLTIVNKDTVYITGMHGTMNRKMMKELAAWCHLHHIKNIHSFRKTGGIKDYKVSKYTKEAHVAE